MTFEQEVLADLDEQIRVDCLALAQQALDAGWSSDELPTILRPWFEKVAAVRARALARFECVKTAH